MGGKSSSMKKRISFKNWPNSEKGGKGANPNLNDVIAEAVQDHKARIENNTSQVSTSTFHNSLQRHNATSEAGSQSPPSSNGEIVVALFNFVPRVRREIGFNAGDYLHVIRREDSDWLYARHSKSEVVGLIPSNFVAPVTSLETYEWYFGQLFRRNAESLLLTKPDGTFLVRDSVSKPGDFALSIKDTDERRGHHVKHYIIKCVDGEYSIFNRMKFSNLNSLIEEYKVRSHGLPVLLTNPCSKITPQLYDLSSETKDEWEINRLEISLIDEIGTGNFGNVYRGLWRETTEVAVKVLKRGKMTSEKFLEEAKIMKGLRHENILSLLATCSREEPFYIITEFMKLGSLLALLKDYQKDRQDLSVDGMLGFAFQIARGMEYLEQKNLVHRDLAARNVLVNEVPICKIADFGLAKIVEDEKLRTVCRDKFPVKWSPPETFRRGEYSVKSDVWSFGIVVIEIFTYGATVYPNMGHREVQQYVENGYRLQQPPSCPLPTYEVLLKCWSHNPEERPNFRDLVDFFDESRHKIVDGTQYLTEEVIANIMK